MKSRLFIASVAIVVLTGTIFAAGALAVQQGWRPPKWLSFVNLAGNKVQAVDVGLFCHEHGVPEKFCTLCHAELNDKLLMCPEHGLPEEICTLCHPENEQKYGLKMICRDHGVPEPFCVKCNPGLAAGEVDTGWCPAHGVPESLCTLCDPALKETLAMCPDHGLPESLCTVCHPDLAENFLVCPTHRLPVGFCPNGLSCPDIVGLKCPDGTCPLVLTEGAKGPASEKNPAAGSPGAPKKSLPRVRFAAADVSQAIGLETAPVESRSSAPMLRANAEVGYDETRLVHVLPRVAGILHEIRVELGDKVRRGEIVAVVDSAELGQAKADYLATRAMLDLAEKNMARLQKIEGVVAGKSLLEAEAELGRSQAELLKVRQRLLNFGLSATQIDALSSEREEDRNLLPIIAPEEGTVIERPAVAGEAVQATTTLLAIADLSTFWVHMDVYEKDLPRVSLGQPMVLRIPGLAPLEFPGKVSWIDSRVDDKTRTIHVRADVANKKDLLRANMFGEAEIRLGDWRSSLTVPARALQWEGTSYVVFSQKEAGLFEPHRVVRGRQHGGRVELVWTDLSAGTPVVTTGSFLLKTEIMKGSIGAGCCGE